MSLLEGESRPDDYGGKRKGWLEVGAAVRSAWALWAVTLALALVSLVLRITAGISLYEVYPAAEAFYRTLFWMVIVPMAAPAYATAGAAIVSSRPRNWIGWLVLLLAFLLVVEDLHFSVIDRLGGPGLAESTALAVFVARFSAWMEVLLFPPVPFTLLLLIFPSGRLLSKGWKVFAGAALLGAALRIAAGMIEPTFTAGAVQQLSNPTGIPGSEGLALALDKLGMGIAFLGLAGAILAAVVRWMRSKGSDRQQLKWMTYPSLLLLGAMILGVGGSNLPGAVHFIGIARVAGAAVLALGAPAALWAAMLKHRLFDVDLLINRTLVYALLIVSLLLLYLGSVILLQTALQQASGQVSELAVVVSTLGIAALFTPLHRRIRVAIDRRFYRAHYDAVKTLSAFSETLRDEVALDALKSRLVSTVDESFQPAHCSIWLREPTEKGSWAER